MLVGGQLKQLLKNQPNTSIYKKIGSSRENFDLNSFASWSILIKSVDDIYQISLLTIIGIVHNVSKISTQKQAQTETEADRLSSHDYCIT